jgi:hypothetical protein
MYGVRSTAKVNHIDSFGNPEYLRKEMKPVHLDFCDYYGYTAPTDALIKPLKESGADSSLGTALMLPSGSELENVQAQVSQFLQTAVAKVIFQDTKEDFEQEKQKMYNTLMELGYADLVDYYLKEYAKMEDKLKELAFELN